MPGIEKLINRLKTNPKSASFEDLDKILVSLGYERRNSGGSHFVYRMKGAPTQTLPRQKPMKICYVKDTLKIYEKLKGK
jgi:ycfA family protein